MAIGGYDNNHVELLDAGSWKDIRTGKVSRGGNFRLEISWNFTDYVYHINIYKYASVSLEDKVIVFGGSSDEADVDTVAQFYSVSGEYRWKQLG